MNWDGLQFSVASAKSPPLLLRDDILVGERGRFTVSSNQSVSVRVTAAALDVYEIEVCNNSSSEYVCDYAPAFGDLRFGNAATYGPEELFIRHARVSDDQWLHQAEGFLGGVGPVSVHVPGDLFSNCMFVTRPVDDGYVCVLLRVIEGTPVMPRGSSLKLRCHLHTAAGGRNAALSYVFRENLCFVPQAVAYDMSRYDRLPWVKDMTCAWMNWAWDRTVMDPETGQYRLYESLVNLRDRVGQIDLYVLWPFWPRAGFDERGQFGHYRSFPGGLAGLRQEISRVQTLGTKVILAYCLWSESDRPIDDPTGAALLDQSFCQLLEVGQAVDADGFDLDCLSEAPQSLEELSIASGKEYLPYSEGDPGYAKSQFNLLGRLHDSLPMPELNLKRYILPHHPMLRVTGPGLFGRSMRKEMVLSFFSGHGVEFNTMFATHDANAEADLSIWRRAHGILQTHRDCFRSTRWEPFVPVADHRLWANHWPAPGRDLYTLCSTAEGGYSGDILRVPADENVHYVDLFRMREARLREENGEHLIGGYLEGFEADATTSVGSASYTAGCLCGYRRLITARLDMERLTVTVAEWAQGHQLTVSLGRSMPSKSVRIDTGEESGQLHVEANLYDLFGFTTDAIVIRLADANDQTLDVRILSEDTVRLFTKSLLTVPPGGRANTAEMVLVPAGDYDYVLRQSQPIWFNTYANLSAELSALYSVAPPTQPRRVHVPAFRIDKYPVTNEKYLEFVHSTGYRGGDSTVERAGFLQHLSGLTVAAAHAQRPVVYVSYRDAAEYCAWAGLRLPSEEEWQYAAGAADGRNYPWGNQADDTRYNATGELGLVDAHPEGESPFGVADLVGNVYQMMNGVVTNGSHDMVYLRGGCYYSASQRSNSEWWVRGGLKRIDDHRPLPLFGPSMNRLSTVGFRCVADVA